MSDSSGAREDAVIAKYADRIVGMFGSVEIESVLISHFASLLRDFLGELHGGERDTAGDADV